MKKDVAKWQTTPDGTISPTITPKAENGNGLSSQTGQQTDQDSTKSETSIDKIPTLEYPSENATGTDEAAAEGMRERKQ